MSQVTSRSAYTAIELAMVLGIVAMLSSITTPSLLTALRRASISEAADAIVQVSREARELSRRGVVQPEYYGVVVGVDQAGGYVALTRGTTAGPATILNATRNDGSTAPVMRVPIGGQARLMVDGEALLPGEHLGWLHQYRSGAVVTDNFQSAEPVSIGIPGSPIAEHLGVVTPDGRYAADVRIFAVGAATAEVKAF